jgi:hypothetical protein
MTEVVANDKAGEVLVVCRRSGRVVLFHKDTHGRINRILLTKDGVHSLSEVLTSVAWENMRSVAGG